MEEKIKNFWKIGYWSEISLEKVKKFLKELNKIQIVLYIILIVVDIYILGSIDFIEHKILGVLFVEINACIIFFIKYGKGNKK